MKHEIDTGTPETQRNLKQAKALRRKGLDYLHQQGSITLEQYRAGLDYRAAWQSVNGSPYGQSTLGRIATGDAGVDYSPSDHWLSLLGGKDAALLHARLQAQLFSATQATKGSRILEIIQRMAGHEDWSVQDVMGLIDAVSGEQIGRQKAQKMIHEAFDALLDALRTIKANNKRAQNNT